MVSEFEERDAARHAGYPWRTWRRLPRDERVEAIAHYRLSNLVGLHAQDAVQREQQKRAREEAQRQPQQPFRRR